MSAKPFSSVICGADVRARNDAVRKALDGYGDDGSEVRHVVHYFYPAQSKAPDPSAILSNLEAYGYLAKLGANGGLKAEEHREVASADFDQTTQGLNDVAHKLGWRYDGWECEVVGG